jgi:allantoate deiminase
MATIDRIFRVDPATMENYIETLGKIGWEDDCGAVRFVYTSAWVEARKQLAAFMQAAGLEVREDAVGNLFGRLRGTDDSRTILTGSHVDTVRCGGRYDGILGILSGLGALKTLREQAGQPQRSLEVVALCEEEGSRYHATYWGTRAIWGMIRAEELDAMRDEDDISIGEAMRSAGFAPERYREAARSDIAMFLEMHIEQGRILYDEHIELGIVEAIQGVLKFQVTVRGRAEHAGATPMDIRRDAFQGAAQMALDITRMVEERGRPAVVTMGRWDVRPGGVNVVPSEVRFSIDLRHPDETILQELAHICRDTCQTIAQQRGLKVTVEQTENYLPAQMDASLQRILIASAQTCGASWKHIVSGAGHDSEQMSRHVPAAMLFVPSVDGLSHNPAEYTPLEDVVRGVTVLAITLYQVAY